MEERAEGGVIAMYNFIAIYRILRLLEDAGYIKVFVDWSIYNRIA